MGNATARGHSEEYFHRHGIKHRHRRLDRVASLYLAAIAGTDPCLRLVNHFLAVFGVSWWWSEKAEQPGRLRGCMAAWSAKDIARIKARIPEDFRPSHDADGLLSNAFFSAELERHNLGMGFAQNGGDAASPNFILSGAQQNAMDAQLSGKEREKREADRRHVVTLIIGQIEERNRQIAENLARMEELDAQETALRAHIERLQRGEDIELDAQGRLKDKDAEAAIREYEERYGVKVDRTDVAQLAIILQGIEDEQMCIRRATDDLIAENEHDRQLAIEMGADPASIPATVRTLEQTADGQRSVDKATAEMTDVSQKRQVAEMITADKESRDFAIDGAVKNDTFFDAGAEIETPSDKQVKLPTPT